MTDLYLVPRWFFGFDIALELTFAFVTCLVAIYSFYIYRLSGERQVKLFGLGFLTISLSYVFWSVINFIATSAFDDSRLSLSLEKLSMIGTIGVYGHMLLMVVGLATLAYLTLGAKGYRAYSLFVSLSLIFIIFSASKAIALYFLSSLFLLYIIMHYIIEYRVRGRTTTLLVLTGFVFLLFGNLDFVLASVYQVHYIIGHLLIFVGYVLIAISLLKTVKK